MSQNLQDWREETDAIIEELLADGSNPEAVYTIEHHFACQDFNRLEKLAVELFKLGFELTDAEEMELDDGAPIFCCDATSEGALESERILDEIGQLLPVCARFGVDYDGWGTFFEE